MARKVYKFIKIHSVIRLDVKSNSDLTKIKQKEAYDLGVKYYQFKLTDLVMLYNHSVASKKLHPAYCSPFKIIDFSRDFRKSFKLKQLEGTPIPCTFYRDSLKLFQPRKGYLISKSDKTLP
jgi:hypothetical protein